MNDTDERHEVLHKFDQPMTRPLTYRERFRLEYASHFIPFLKLLEQEIGREPVIQSLQQLALQEAEEYARYIVQTKGKNDLSVFKENYGPTTPGISDVLTIEVTEESDTVYEIKISECLWASVFRENDAAHLGYAAVCCGDAPFARFVNPHIDLDLDGTIMEGKPSCRLRYYVK